MSTTRKRSVIGPSTHPRPTRHRTARKKAHGNAVKFERILVPTDFSDFSRKALTYAARFVEQFGSRLTLIYVLEPVLSPDFAHSPLALDDETVVENVRRRLVSLGRSCVPDRFVEDVIVKTGKPFDEITKAARDLKMDLIIIATHGFTGIKRALLGSTAERVVRHAPCPGMTVR